MNLAGIVSTSLIVSLSVGALVIAHYEDRLIAAWYRLVDRVTSLHPAPEEDDYFDYY
jgi:hypothetical protein